MSVKKSNSNDADYTIPIAESTHIEAAACSTPSSSKFAWGAKFTPRPRQKLTAPTHNSADKTVNRPKKLDAQIYRDTQSKGLTSRIVKYHETNEAKSKPLINPTYNRVGDFPIVHLDKKNISLKPSQQNGSATSKVNIGPPIRTNNPTSARSMIFRTGKNYGDTPPVVTNGHLVTPSENEPLALHTNDYEISPTRSVLDALKEISRKRIHCDELDGDTVKKQKSSCALVAENVPNASSTPNITKRGRDKTSPTNYSSTPETQNKRCRNNDISSSLSSSLQMNSPKRNLEILPSPAKTAATSYTQTHVSPFSSDESNKSYEVPGIKGRPSIHDDILYHTEPEKPAVKPQYSSEPVPLSSIEVRSKEPSGSDQIEAKSQISSKLPQKTPKFTLFNKQYDIPQNENEAESEESDYEESKISFIKPKSRANTVFSAANKGAKSKLAMMLSYLDDGSKDVVDGGSKSKEKPVSTSVPETANISTHTSVTFSTATTTSILNLPVSSTNAEPTKLTTVSTDDTSIPTPVAIATTKVEKPDAIATTKVEKSDAEISKSTLTLTTSNDLNKTFGIDTKTPSNASSSTAERIGGFCFAATLGKSTLTMSSNSSPTSTMSVTISASSLPINTMSASATAAIATPASALVTTTSSVSSTPTFTFKLPAQKLLSPATTSQSNEISPAFTFTTPQATTAASDLNKTFGIDTKAQTSNAVTAAANDLNKTFGIDTKAQTLNAVTNSAPSTAGNFSFGKQSNSTLPTNASINFGGIPASTTTMTSSPALPTTTPGTTSNFSFGQQSNTILPTNASIKFGGIPASTITTTSSVALPTSIPQFSFGGQTPAFGTSNISLPATTALATTTTSATSTTSAPFSFGNSNTKFGSTTTSTPAVPMFSFGNKAKETIATTASQLDSSNIFGSTMAPVTTATNVFGSSTSAPTFGSAASNQPAFGTNFTTPFGSAPSAPIFGSTASNPPSFGSLQTNAFGTSNTQNQTGSTNLFGSQTQQPPSNVFGFTATTTTSSNVFGGSNAPAPVFAFGGQSNNNANTAIFGSEPKTAEVTASFTFRPNSNANSVVNSTAQTAPPAFGTGGFSFSAQQQNEAKPGFSFNTPNNAIIPAAPAPAFGFSSPPPNNNTTFGGNNLNSTFSFGSNSNAPDASKTFNFSGNNENTSFGAPPPANEPFSFNTGAAPTMGTGAFQFNASAQPVSANIFSVPPGGASNTNKGRPIRQATRRIVK